MIRILPVLLATIALVPSVAHSSWFEFCDIEGQIENASPEVERGAYELTVTVVNAARAREFGELSYTDCTEHIGTAMRVSLSIPPEGGIPSVGDRVRFSRSLVDTFDAQGAFLGAEEKNRFLELNRR